MSLKNQSASDVLTQSPSTTSSPGKPRLHGLDTLRLVCALIVTMGHLGHFPLTTGIDETSLVGRLVNALWASTVNGPAAVIVFFVISGLCIHYPYADGSQPRLWSYYARRYIRIGIPMLAAIALGAIVGIKTSQLDESILWSLICEIIYYTLYPLLIFFKKRIGWKNLIFVAFLAAGLMPFIGLGNNGNYPSFGIGLNWLLGLPCWLVGCYLAEQLRNHSSERPSRIWTWRLGILALGSFVFFLRFHTPLTYPYTLNFFSIAAALYVYQEVAYAREAEDSPLLERMGAWSYSIYLMHLPAAMLFQKASLPTLGYVFDWCLLMSWVLFSSFAFYKLVEKPAHQFARSIKSA